MPLAGAIGAYGLLTSILSTTTSLFLTTAVHAGPLLIGLFFAGRGAVSILVSLGVGPVSDRLPDRRLLLLIAGLGGAVGGVCFAVLRDYAAVFASGVVFFSIGMLSFSQLFAYANEYAYAHGRPVAMFTSVLRAVFSASWVIGPPAGLYLLTRYGFGPLYLVAGGLSFLTAVFGWWLRPLDAPEQPAPPADRPSSPPSPRRWPRAPGCCSARSSPLAWSTRCTASTSRSTSPARCT